MDQKIRGITVTINGDTTGLGKALDTVKKQSIGLNRELKSVNKALNFNPSSASLLTEKQKVLTDSVRAAREELKTLEAAQADVEKMYASGDIDRGAYLEFQRQLEAARANVERLQDQLVEFGGAAGQIMQQAGKKVSEFGSTVEGIGNKLMPISAATAAAGAATVKMAWDFEDSMAKVSTIADTTEVPLEDLQAAILELSDESGIAAGEIAENVYNAISAGQKTGDAVNFVRHATDLARAGFADSGNSLDLLTTIMNAYKLEANEVTNVAISEHVANLLATIENPSSTAQALRIVFAATGEVTNPFLTDVKRQETLQIGTTAKPFVLHNGEVVTVTTSLSNMHIMLASRGVQTEITNKAVWPVAWLKLHPGENLFRYGAASGEQSLQVQIWHRQSYGGA